MSVRVSSLSVYCLFPLTLQVILEWLVFAEIGKWDGNWGAVMGQPLYKRPHHIFRQRKKVKMGHKMSDISDLIQLNSTNLTIITTKKPLYYIRWNQHCH